MFINIQERIKDALMFVQASKRNNMDNDDILWLMSLQGLATTPSYIQSELVINIIKQEIA